MQTRTDNRKYKSPSNKIICAPILSLLYELAMQRSNNYEDIQLVFDKTVFPVSPLPKYFCLRRVLKWIHVSCKTQKPVTFECNASQGYSTSIQKRFYKL